MKTSLVFCYLCFMSKKTFPRAERLKSRKTISALFRGGASYSAYPIRVVWSETETKTDDGNNLPTIQAGFSVPKKRFKTAVARNLLKRRMREAYRLQKPKLINKLTARNKKISCMFIFTGKEIVDYQNIFEATGKIVWRLGKIGDPTFVVKPRKSSTRK